MPREDRCDASNSKSALCNLRLPAAALPPFLSLFTLLNLPAVAFRRDTVNGKILMLRFAKQNHDIAWLSRGYCPTNERKIVNCKSESRRYEGVRVFHIEGMGEGGRGRQSS